MKFPGLSAVLAITAAIVACGSSSSGGNEGSSGSNGNDSGNEGSGGNEGGGSSASAETTPCSPPQERKLGTQCAARHAGGQCAAYLRADNTVYCTHSCDSGGRTCESGSCTDGLCLP